MATEGDVRYSIPEFGGSPVGYTCDWGYCDRRAVVYRYSRTAGWLPTCRKCAKENPSPRKATPMGDENVVESLHDLIEDAGGKVTEVGGPLPDGSGFMTASFSLPKDHWLYVDGHNEPPMPMRTGTAAPEYRDRCEVVRAAARYAIRAATMNGTVVDFDPDAMVQNFMVGLLGYHTPDGLSFCLNVVPEKEKP